jgi:hypothetical protein
MRKLIDIIENPKGITEWFLRGLIACIFAMAGAAGLFAFVWAFWIIFG